MAILAPPLFGPSTVVVTRDLTEELPEEDADDAADLTLLVPAVIVLTAADVRVIV